MGRTMSACPLTGTPAALDVFLGRNLLGRILIMRTIKCLKSVRWMPWHAQAMKDVVRCEKPWGAANKL